MKQSSLFQATFSHVPWSLALLTQRSFPWTAHGNYLFRNISDELNLLQQYFQRKICTIIKITIHWQQPHFRIVTHGSSIIYFYNHSVKGENTRGSSFLIVELEQSKWERCQISVDYFRELLVMVSSFVCILPECALSTHRTNISSHCGLLRKVVDTSCSSD